MKQIFNCSVMALAISFSVVACNNSGDTGSTTDSTQKNTTSDTSQSKPTNTVPDAVTAAPDRYTVAKDSAGIRILNISYKPGDSAALHSHPDLVLYVTEGGKTEFTAQDGSKQVHDLNAGLAMIVPAETHSVKNIGNTTTKGVLIEVTRANNATSPIGDDMDPMKVSADMHKLIKDTMNIRAMIFTAKPGASTPKHSHPDHAIYVIEGGPAEFTSQDGTKQVRELQKGMAAINPAATHSFKNVGKNTIKVLVVEVKRTAQ